ncbi:MAG: hypothetical protein ALAOOOJD_01783 [bacterium]|nr:hypothetical protein [bacterium]
MKHFVVAGARDVNIRPAVIVEIAEQRAAIAVIAGSNPGGTADLVEVAAHVAKKQIMAGEIANENIEIAVPIIIVHRGALAVRAAETNAPRTGFLAKTAATAVEIKQIVRAGSPRHEYINIAVIIDIESHRLQAFALRADAAGTFIKTPTAALDVEPVAALGLRNKQIEPAIVIKITPRHALALPIQKRPALRGYVGKRIIAVIAPQNIAGVSRADVDVGIAVVVEIRCRHAAIMFRAELHPGGGGNVGERRADIVEKIIGRAVRNDEQTGPAVPREGAKRGAMAVAAWIDWQ